MVNCNSDYSPGRGFVFIAKTLLKGFICTYDWSDYFDFRKGNEVDQLFYKKNGSSLMHINVKGLKKKFI
ncbi:MAG: hypothetical protein KKF48_00740 [Nanoarchaeota archaeon]|nr:hypothetical protein [Nanoarchaeota archaeon]MBU1027550.1 hypothetical protein [Nanoarchaeota archaeon]